MNIDYYVPYRVIEEESRSTSLIRLTESMSRKGHNVRIFAPYSDIKNKNVEIYTGFFKNRVLGNFLLNVTYFFRYFLGKPDVIIVRPDSFLFFSFLFFKKLVKVQNIHSELDEERKIGNVSLGVGMNMWVTGIYRWLLRRYARLYVFNHPALEEYFSGKYNLLKHTSIYNGINLQDFYCLEISKKEHLFEKYSIPRGELIFSFAGNVNPWHGLVEVCEYLDYYTRRFGVKIRFIIIGPVKKTELNFLESFNFVHLMGKKTKLEVNEILNLSDVCVVNVLPIRVSPGSPIKLFDYVALKKPILTKKNVTGYSDIVEDYHLGYASRFKKDDLSEFHQFAQSFEVNKVDYDRVISEYSWDSQATKWLSFIEEGIECRQE